MLVGALVAAALSFTTLYLVRSWPRPRAVALASQRVVARPSPSPPPPVAAVVSLPVPVIATPAVVDAEPPMRVAPRPPRALPRAPTPVRPRTHEHVPVE